MFAIIMPTLAGQLPTLADSKLDALEKAEELAKKHPGYSVFICKPVYQIKSEIRYELISAEIK